MDVDVWYNLTSEEPEVVLPLKFHRDSERIISIPSGEGKVVVLKSGVYRLEDDIANMFIFSRIDYYRMKYDFIIDQSLKSRGPESVFPDIVWDPDRSCQRLDLRVSVTDSSGGSPLQHTNAKMDGFEVRMYFIEILRKMNASVSLLISGYLALMNLFV